MKKMCHQYYLKGTKGERVPGKKGGREKGRKIGQTYVETLKESRR